MKFTWIAISLISLGFCASANAQEQNADLQYNSFGKPEQTIAVVESIVGEVESKSFLDCNNQKMIEEMRQAITKKEQEQGLGNLIAQRNKKLALKNAQNFTKLDLDSFKPADSYPLANRMISIKMNNKIHNADLNVCMSNNPIIGRRIYLVGYQVPEGILVEVVNYFSSESDVAAFILDKK